MDRPRKQGPYVLDVITSVKEVPVSEETFWALTFNELFRFDNPGWYAKHNWGLFQFALSFPTTAIPRVQSTPRTFVAHQIKRR